MTDPGKVLLIGMMGAGKSTTGHLLSARLGWPYLDSDDEIERETGRTVPQIWKEDGEPAFRREESRVLEDACTRPGPAIVAVAGGAVLDLDNRAVIRRSGLVVWLRAEVTTLRGPGRRGRRAPAPGGRPYLRPVPPVAAAGPCVRRAGRPGVRRRPDVAAAGRGADHRGRGGQVGHAVNELTVELGDRSYPVLVGAGARHRLGQLLPLGATRAAVVTQPDIPWAVDCGIEQRTFLIGDGEDEKNMETVEELCRGFARWGLHRRDVVVAVGGGVVTDVAGFAAAVYHRGVAVIHVPTSLLGQVDAAIGGKTGVNLAEGKNLVGSFWQPAAVLCDTETLTTLPPREYRSGLGEMAKYRFLGVSGLRDMPLDDAVAACVACKAAVVADDERESGRRALLNYGHTLAHALETAGHYDLRHGEAVAIGLVFAARLAERLGRIGEERGPAARRPGRLLRSAHRGSARPGRGRPGHHHGAGQEGGPGWPDLRAGRPGRPRGGGRGATRRGGRSTRREPAVTARLVVLLSGPNLQLLGGREPHIYGLARLQDHVDSAVEAAARHGLEMEHHQSDHEGDLVAHVHRARAQAAAIIVNPGALTHYGWSLHDALAAFDGPVIELHLSNPEAREPWRRTSVIAPVATGSITGLGGIGYALAVEAVARLLASRN